RGVNDMSKKRAVAATAGAHAPAIRISGIMIVKNEEVHLARSLRALAKVVDEIIVVDTGSTDKTMDIARAHHAKLFQFEWCNDFSAARNESLRHATGDWLVWIDADEELLETKSGALRALCAMPELPDGFLITCKNLLNESGKDYGTVI